MLKTFIIAEAGVNHNGSIEIAKQLIDNAKASGADAVKFQTFKAESLVTKGAEKANYQKAHTYAKESQYEMIKRLELGESSHLELIDYCKRRKLIFLSSPFDLKSIELLNGFGLEIIKVPSGEIINLPYLRRLGELNKKVILSTGMATLGEIENALNVLVKNGTDMKRITVLHCNSEYPTPYEDVNLRAMLTIRNAFNVSVGYSDHTMGIEIPIAAVALGATVIEKHFTIDKNLDGPDHKASIEPSEFKIMVMAIRNIEKALGDGIKKPSNSELQNLSIVRKSIVAIKNISKGELLSNNNIGLKRPGTGLSPMKWDEVIGKKAKKKFDVDDLIEI